jgi:hypothetical protein
MGLLDSIVDRCFRDEKTGRVIVFPADRRKRGYLVKGESAELRIRSFLKMFFAAHLSILSLGYLLAYAWSHELAYAFDQPAAHLVRTLCIFIGMYALVVGLPYFLFLRAYKIARSSFVSAQDEVVVSGKGPARPQVLIAVGLIVAGIAILLGIVWLTRFKS